MRPFSLGVIEGFYGRPWTHAARLSTAAWLAANGYGFYVYAPKGDRYLRKSWREAHPDEMVRELTALSAACRAAGVVFGVGLSPYEIYREWSAADKSALAAKLEQLDEIGVDLIGLLFDDMRGDLPRLAATQAEIGHFVLERTKAKHIVLCPTYYADDPVLERVFGKAPDLYLEELGKALDPAIGLFWTGERVVSKSYSAEHLARVAERMGRKPFLWDNYPVNDSARMCPHLHISAVEGRGGDLKTVLAGHAVNPMNEAFLSRIPMKTQAESYRLGADYRPMPAFEAACRALAGDPVGRFLIEDRETLHGLGLARMGEGVRAALLSQYGAHRGNPYAEEVIDFLSHGFAFDPACLTD